MQEAEEIFGNVDELLSMYEERKRAARGGDDLLDDLEEEELDEAELDDEAIEQRRLARVRACGRKGRCRQGRL